MITIVTWLWNSGFREYLPEHVNVLANMFARHLDVSHEVVCITDGGTDGFSDDIVVVAEPAAAARAGYMPSPEGKRFPSCYRRLWMFSAEAADLGDRFLLVDIDLVLTANITSLVETQPGDTFLGWEPMQKWGPRRRIAGGLYRLDAGRHQEVWEKYQGAPSIAEARAAGYRGSDQAWLSYMLAERCSTWPLNSGIYSIRDMRDGRDPLPPDARLVQFNGPVKPWQSSLSWVRDHWR